MALLLACGMPVLAQDAGAPSLEDAIVDAVAWLVRDTPRCKLARSAEARERMAHEILVASESADLDPWLVLVTAERESSLRQSAYNPTLGERGLMQVHGKAARGCDLSTSLGQLRCGARWLRSRIDHCGSVERGIAAYVSGSCKLSGHAAWSAGDRMRGAERLRGRFSGR